MDPGKVIAAIVLVGGAYWLITGINPLSLFGMDTSAIDNAINPQVGAAARTLAERQALDAQAAAQRSGKGGYTLTTGGAATAGGIAAGAGLATSTVLLTAGIGAAAALLVWGITQRGWFRGGEEGIRVNPARDEFLNVWVQNYYPGTPAKIGDSARDTQVTDPVTGYNGDAQYSAMVRAFHDAGVNGNLADQTIIQLYAADTMDEFQAAAENFLRVLQNGR
jgi:hypothetical protein